MGGCGSDAPAACDTTPATAAPAGLTVLAADLKRPYDLTIDATGVYWTDMDMGTVNSVPLSGGTPFVLASDMPEPSALVIDADNVYWTNLGIATDEGSVLRVAKAGGPLSILAYFRYHPFGHRDRRGVHLLDELRDRSTRST